MATIINGCDTMIQINTAAKLQTLQNNGYYSVGFLGRYLQNAQNGTDKKLTIEEVCILSNASIGIVSIYQISASNADYFSTSRGVSDATDAISCSTAIGQPNATPIYFAVDFWPKNDTEYTKVMSYFSGINQILLSASQNPRGYLLGAYGCSNVLQRIKAVYPSSYTMLWGTDECSDGTSFNNWNIRQGSQHLIGSGTTLMNICVDIGKANATGEWLHTHTYTSGWSNYNNPAYHRRACTICGAYTYQTHVLNSNQTKCKICGYSGNIVSPSYEGEDSNV